MNAFKRISLIPLHNNFGSFQFSHKKNTSNFRKKKKIFLALTRNTDRDTDIYTHTNTAYSPELIQTLKTLFASLLSNSASFIIFFFSRFSYICFPKIVSCYIICCVIPGVCIGRKTKRQQNRQTLTHRESYHPKSSKFHYIYFPLVEDIERAQGRQRKENICVCLNVPSV